MEELGWFLIKLRLGGFASYSEPGPALIELEYLATECHTIAAFKVANVITFKVGLDQV